MKGSPVGATPWSKTCTMCGLFTRAAAVASLVKRAIAPAVAAWLSVMNFTATCVPRARWSATQTLPIPPSAKRRTRRTEGVTRSPSESIPLRTKEAREGEVFG
jgi:hypothetical protein